MEITPKSWWCGQIYNSFLPLKHIWAKFIHTRVCLHYMEMCGSEVIFQFELKLSELATKISLWHIEKLRIRQGKSSNHFIFRGVPPKISFSLCPIYDSPFSWTPCSSVLKSGDLGDESMQIPNIQVTLLSEQPLTMNLINEYGEYIFLLIYTYKIFQEMLHMSIWRIESVVSHWYPSSTHSCNETSIRSGSRTTHLYV